MPLPQLSICMTKSDRQTRTEFSMALNQVSAERGIDPQIVLESIESAILAAYKKDIGLDPLEEGYSIKLNPQTGEATILHGQKDVTPPGFGRIAAQTAKQVVLQRIREAEKAAIIDEFSGKLGTIINAMVLRFDNRHIVVDIGRGEALMPPEEQIPHERYRLNQRLVVYLKEIATTHRGDAIIVSRSAPELVSQLFAREVPEIASTAVKIKHIAREAGVRTKLAVFSTQSGVDPVGSCVGQKGIRVQAVIRELNNEKIDIVQHSDDPKKFIIAALSPAANLQITIDNKEKKAEITAPDDMLSLAIGREGQNVRLAAKLTGYAINIKSKSGKNTVLATTTDLAPSTTLNNAGLPASLTKKLIAAGYQTVGQLQAATDQQLLSLNGVGKKAVEKIRLLVGNSVSQI